MPLAQNHYGKSRVRLVKVTREQDLHHLHEWTVGVSLTGDFTACFVAGDNTGILATDTMKNTVYSLARTSTADTMEAFALELAAFLSERNPQATSIRITVEEKTWVRIKAVTPSGSPGTSPQHHPSAFLQRGPEVHTCTALSTPSDPPTVTAGVRGLVILKTGQSAFHGFKRDDLTTLPDSFDRLLGTEATIEWPYTRTDIDFNKTRYRIFDTLLSTFANHESLSVQHTLYAMAQAALATAPEIDEITLTMPNRHNIPVDLSRFHQDNPNTLFIPTDEPHGHIHARITRESKG